MEYLLVANLITRQNDQRLIEENARRWSAPRAAGRVLRCRIA
jgi:hypothetical protein